MNCQLISIGDELLTGQVVNTNAAAISQMLHGIGIQPVAIYTIPDRTDAIISFLRHCWDTAELVIMTGGLGPTKDDITKQALADFLHVGMEFSEPTYQRLVKLLGRFSVEITEAHRAQCYIPANATLLTNDQGTAPGMYFSHSGKHLFVLPGVPYEMTHLMETRVLPMIEEINGRHGTLAYNTICTAGVGESQLASELSDIESAMPDHIKIAYLPRPGQVRLRIVWNGPSPGDMREKLDWWTSTVVSRIRPHVYATFDIPLAAALGETLRGQGATLSVAESCTGGYLGHLITAIPGSSDYFAGGAITYSNAMKMHLLGVSRETLEEYGAVSEQTAREMVRGALTSFGSTYAIAVTGVAGPGGGSEAKPAGTVWIAVAGHPGVQATKFRFGKDRERNIELSAVAALNMLRKFLNSTP